MTARAGHGSSERTNIRMPRSVRPIMPMRGRRLATWHESSGAQLQLQLEPSTVARRSKTVSGNKSDVILTYGANLE